MGYAEVVVSFEEDQKLEVILTLIFLLEVRRGGCVWVEEGKIGESQGNQKIEDELNRRKCKRCPQTSFLVVVGPL